MPVAFQTVMVTVLLKVSGFNKNLLELDKIGGAAAATISLATTVSVAAVPGVLAVPGVGPGSVVFPPVMVAASFAALVMAVSGVLAVPGVGPVVVGVSGVIPASNWFGLSSQVPGVGAGEVALPGVLVIVHPGRNLLHRDRNDAGLKDWMRINTADILIVLFAGLSEIFSVSLSPLVPRVEVPGSVNALWVFLLISDPGLLESFGQTCQLERSVKPGLDAFRFRRSSQPKLDGQLLLLLLRPAGDLSGDGVNSA